jgi:hypothetical protein
MALRQESYVVLTPKCPMLHLATILHSTSVLPQKVTGYSDLKKLELNSEGRV